MISISRVPDHVRMVVTRSRENGEHDMFYLYEFNSEWDYLNVSSEASDLA